MFGSRSESNTGVRGSQEPYGASQELATLEQPLYTCEVESHGSGAKQYFTYRAKVSHYDLDQALVDITRLEERLGALYGGQADE